MSKERLRKLAAYLLIYIISFTATTIAIQYRARLPHRISSIIDSVFDYFSRNPVVKRITSIIYDVISEYLTKNPVISLINTTIPEILLEIITNVISREKISSLIPDVILEIIHRLITHSIIGTVISEIETYISARYPLSGKAEDLAIWDTYILYESPPRIHYVVWYPKNPLTDIPVMVYANITDPDNHIVEVILSYFNGTAWNNITMSYNDTLKLYVGEIPGLPVNTNCTFRVYARDETNYWTKSDDYNYTVLAEDSEPPTIVNVTWSPKEPLSTQSVSITANITDNSGVQLAILEYFNGTDYVNVTMDMDIPTGLFTATIPPLPDGLNVTFRVYAKDYADNWCKSSTLHYTVVDEKAPDIVEVYWTPEHPAENENVTIYANVTDIGGVSEVILSYSYDSQIVNESMAYNSTLGLWVGEIPNLPAMTEVKFRVYACDIYGNWNVSDEYGYVVRDITAPQIISIWWNPSEPSEYQPVVVYANITDNVGVSSAILSYSADGISWTNVSMIYNATIGLWVGEIPGMAPLTEVRFKVYTNDTSGNWNISGEFIYVVRDTLPPIIHSVTVPESAVEGETITIYANISDNVGVSSVILGYFDGSTWMNVSMTYDNETGLWVATIENVPAGELRFRVYVNDTSGNWAISDEYICRVSPRTTTTAVPIELYVATILVAGAIMLTILLFKRKKKTPKGP